MNKFSFCIGKPYKIIILFYEERGIKIHAICMPTLYVCGCSTIAIFFVYYGAAVVPVVLSCATYLASSDGGRMCSPP